MNIRNSKLNLAYYSKKDKIGHNKIIMSTKSFNHSHWSWGKYVRYFIDREVLQWFQGTQEELD
jgi:hypothetical protein